MPYIERLLIVLSLLVVGVVASSITASAHHGTSPLFDHDHLVTIHGVVTDFVWRNPHAQLRLRVASGPFRDQNFAIEMHSPNGMRRWGWTRTSIQPGDEITMRVYPAKAGRAAGECQYCTVEIKGKPALKPRE